MLLPVERSQFGDELSVAETRFQGGSQVGVCRGLNRVAPNPHAEVPPAPQKVTTFGDELSRGT